MEIKVKDYHQNKGKYSFSILNNKINGVTGPNIIDIIEILKLGHNKKGNILINNKKLLPEDINNYKSKIRIINKYLDQSLYYYKVYECLYQEIKRRKLALKDPKKKIIDSLKIVGLDSSYLNRNVRDLSNSEKKLLQFSLALMSNPELLIIEEFLDIIDLKTEKRIISLLVKMSEQYNKTIILISNNIDILYQYTYHIIITKNNETLIEGNTQKVLQDVEFLKNNNVPIPEKVEWTFIAINRKKAKIEYHKDVRDMIKDIYKHV